MSSESEQIATAITKHQQIITVGITFCLNLFVTIFLIRREKNQFENRRANDRKYQSDLFLYQNLIIKEVEKYVDSANRVDKTFVDLCGSSQLMVEC